MIQGEEAAAGRASENPVILRCFRIFAKDKSVPAENLLSNPSIIMHDRSNGRLGAASPAMGSIPGHKEHYAFQSRVYDEIRPPRRLVRISATAIDG